MATMSAGRAVIEALRAEGVEYIFGIVGTTTNNIVTELHGRTDIRLLDTRHEQGAALMAHGYARASGKPAVCLTTSGPGTINLITGIALACKGRAPVMVIAGDVPRDLIDRDGNQAFDLVNIFKPVTCFARHVHKTERILDSLRDAFRAAMGGKRGPVMLNIPRDLLDHQTIDYVPRSPDTYRATAARTLGDADAIQRAAVLLAQAQRPLLLAGGGVIDSGATEDAVKLAELLDMALIPSYGHNDALPNSHRLCIGMPGWRGAPEAHEAIHRADVVLALGSRLSQSSTAWNFSIINRVSRIIQIDIDPAEVGRNFPVEIGIVGDAKAVATQLIKAIRQTQGGAHSNEAWRTEIAELKERRRKRLSAEADLIGEPMLPQRAYPELVKVLPRDTMVTVDAGVCPGLAYDRLHFDMPHTMFNYAGQGGLGMGLCVGLGTKLGRPDRPAVTLQGDGGFMYTVQELNTAVRWKIPHVSIVLNNGCHGSEKAQQQRFWNERYVGVELDNPRFDKVAEAFGASGFHVTRPQDIGEAVKAALAIDGPTVVEIPVAQYFPHPPATPGGGERQH
jgi:acetolactate synthase-1/2/3 large subunit/sulfoacetaldehyde acetyltransferase